MNLYGYVRNMGVVVVDAKGQEMWLTHEPGMKNYAEPVDGEVYYASVTEEIAAWNAKLDEFRAMVKNTWNAATPVQKANARLLFRYVNFSFGGTPGEIKFTGSEFPAFWELLLTERVNDVPTPFKYLMGDFKFVQEVVDGHNNWWDSSGYTHHNEGGKVPYAYGDWEAPKVAAQFGKIFVLMGKFEYASCQAISGGDGGYIGHRISLNAKKPKVEFFPKQCIIVWDSAYLERE